LNLIALALSTALEEHTLDYQGIGGETALAVAKELGRSRSRSSFRLVIEAVCESSLTFLETTRFTFNSLLDTLRVVIMPFEQSRLR
jgi:hypothetical protein